VQGVAHRTVSEGAPSLSRNSGVRIRGWNSGVGIRGSNRDSWAGSRRPSGFACRGHDRAGRTRREACRTEAGGRSTIKPDARARGLPDRSVRRKEQSGRTRERPAGPKRAEEGAVRTHAARGLPDRSGRRKRAGRTHAKVGEAGIRTLDTAFRPYNGLANRRLQPLGHLTAARKAKYKRDRDLQPGDCPPRLSRELSLAPQRIRARGKTKNLRVPTGSRRLSAAVETRLSAVSAGGSSATVGSRTSELAHQPRTRELPIAHDGLG
jgi:hypothetical protein